MKKTIITLIVFLAVLSSVFGTVYDIPRFNYGSASMSVGISNEGKAVYVIEASLCPIRNKSYVDAGLITQWTVGNRDMNYLGLKLKFQTGGDKLGVGFAVAAGSFRRDIAFKFELYQYARINSAFDEILVASFDISLEGKKQFSIRAGIQI